VTIAGGTARGVELTDAEDNSVRGMTLAPAAGSTDSAIAVLGDSAGTLIADNQASAIGVTLNVNASHVHVLRNTVTGPGLTSSEKQGPLVVLGNDNRIEQNTARLVDSGGIGRGIGRGSIVVSGDRNLLLRNITNDGLLEGIVIDAAAADSVLIGNTANRNGLEFSFGNGISVEGTSPVSLGDNTANGNAQLGIRAASGATDLGGNHAQGNGDARQCTGVVCQP
jgi:parallel beta-helix repeat protein